MEGVLGFYEEEGHVDGTFVCDVAVDCGVELMSIFVNFVYIYVYTVCTIFSKRASLACRSAERL